MAKRKTNWSVSTGEYGETVRIWEPRKGAALRWDYIGEDGRRTRPEVAPRMKVRATPGGAVDPSVVEWAKALCKQKHAELMLVRTAEPKAEDVFTLAKAYALFFDPRREALPESRSAMVHHKASRAFWTAELGADTEWDSIRPADITAPLLRLRKRGQVQTALKRLSNLRTLRNWLSEEMELDVRDFTRGYRKLRKKLSAAYEPRRPRLTPEQMRALREAMPGFSWRTRLFFTLLLSSGTRGIQARYAMRSGLDGKLEPMPPADVAPHGWFLFIGVKGQAPHLTFLTAHQRAVISETLAGPLAEWEAEYQASGTDYPLLPGGRADRGGYSAEPMSDRMLRYDLDDVFAAIGIEKKDGDRLGFHALRRGWADVVRGKLGLSKMARAGGWSREETAEDYASRYDFDAINEARQVMEAEETRGSKRTPNPQQSATDGAKSE